jgi:hypothetical protein
VSGGITLYKRNFETNGATMNAHNGCIDQWFDGLWAFQDLKGSEDVICYVSDMITFPWELYRWVAGNWTESSRINCSYWGGPIIYESRTVTCKTIASGNTVSNSNCTDTKPVSTRTYGGSCAIYNGGNQSSSGEP